MPLTKLRTALPSSALLLLFASCGGGGGGDSTPPVTATTGRVAVQVSTAGNPPVANYRLAVDGVQRDIGLNSTLTVADLAPGNHILLLNGLPAGCAVAGGETRTVAVTAGQTASATFAVTYTAPVRTGSIGVTTTATAVVGATSFDVAVDGLVVGSIARNGSLTIPDVAVGNHTVALNGVPAFVTVAGGTSRGVAVSENQTAAVDFALTGVVPGVSYLHVTSGNGNTTTARLDHPLLNNNPEAIVLATPNWNPGGGASAYHDHPIGMWYVPSQAAWFIYNEDSSIMTNGLAFNIFIANPTTLATRVLRNSTAVTNWMSLDSITSINGRADAIVFASHYVRYPGFTPVTSNAFGVSYTGTSWQVFHQDQTQMFSHHMFGVVVAGVGWNAFQHTVTNANVAGSGTVLTHPLLDGQPNALVTATQFRNPQGGAGVYNNKNIGVYYDGAHWQVFNQDETAMPVGCGFTILVGDGSGG